MNAIAQIKPADDIRTFMPWIDSSEYELRALLRGYRNTASAMIASTESNTARQLAWLVLDWATPALYAPDAAHALPELNKLCKRLMLTAMQAEQIELCGVPE